ncbi:unnamed protein product [Parajaminaea phylloscopi]
MSPEPHESGPEFFEYDVFDYDITEPRNKRPRVRYPATTRWEFEARIEAAFDEIDTTQCTIIAAATKHDVSYNTLRQRLIRRREAICAEQRARADAAWQNRARHLSTSSPPNALRDSSERVATKAMTGDSEGSRVRDYSPTPSDLVSDLVFNDFQARGMDRLSRTPSDLASDSRFSDSQAGSERVFWPVATDRSLLNSHQQKGKQDVPAAVHARLRTPDVELPPTPKTRRESELYCWFLCHGERFPEPQHSLIIGKLERALDQRFEALDRIQRDLDEHALQHRSRLARQAVQTQAPARSSATKEFAGRRPSASNGGSLREEQELHQSNSGPRRSGRISNRSKAAGDETDTRQSGGV